MDTSNGMDTRSDRRHFNSIDAEIEWLHWVQQKFTSIAGDNGKINFKEFKSALKVKETFFASRFFKLFDKDGDGELDVQELCNGLDTIVRGSKMDKLRFLFEVYDTDGSGSIDRDELRTVLKSSMVESSITLSTADLDSLTDALFGEADVNKDDLITFDEMKKTLEDCPDVLENLSISSVQWLQQANKEKRKVNKDREATVKLYIENNVRQIVFLTLYFLVNVGMFTLSAVRYRDQKPSVIIARGCGMGLNFNCAFILVLMLRKSMTKLRSIKIFHFLPVDDHREFHKICAGFIVLFSVGHTAAHVTNIVVNLQYPLTNFTVVEYLFTTRPGIGWVAGTGPLTGVILCVILAIICICSLPIVRQRGHFEIFYFSHMLFIPFWILVILHGPIFWYFLIVPFIIFLIEKVSDMKSVRSARHGQTYIQEVNLLPSKVTQLIISRPEKMKYKSGDYMFINIPQIAGFEWHPFTISSCPEKKGQLWVHVRSVGYWTTKLHEFFTKYHEPKNGKKKKEKKIVETNHAYDNSGCVEAIGIRQLSSVKINIDEEETIQRPLSRKQTLKRLSSKMRGETNKKVSVKIYIRGPYGTPTRDIFSAEHAVLIGAGIGVTPYASILQSIICRLNSLKVSCPECSHVWCKDSIDAIMKLKKVDFFWINRDQKSFEWFVSMLTQLEIEQASEKTFDRFLDLHLYMTSALSKEDMKSLGLQMALDILYQKENRDLITGLKTRTHAGRPDWNQVFTKLRSEQKGKIKIFYCGPSALAKLLKSHCDEFGFEFSKEEF